MNNQWWYTSNEAKHGPVDGAELRRRAKLGLLKPTDMVWRAGMKSWVQAAKVKGLEFVEPPPIARSPFRTDSHPGSSASSPTTRHATKSKALSRMQILGRVSWILYIFLFFVEILCVAGLNLSGVEDFSIEHEPLRAILGIMIGPFFIMAFFLPSAVAFVRYHRNFMSISVLQIVLGWTGLVWCLALVWAFSKDVEITDRD